MSLRPLVVFLVMQGTVSASEITSVELRLKPFELICSKSVLPVFPPANLLSAQMTQAQQNAVMVDLIDWLSIEVKKRRPSFHLAYNGRGTVTLTDQAGKKIEWRLLHVEPNIQGRSLLEFSDPSPQDVELGNLYVRFPLGEDSRQRAFVEHGKFVPDRWGEEAYRKASYGCATPEQLKNYQKPASVRHCQVDSRGVSCN